MHTAQYRIVKIIERVLSSLLKKKIINLSTRKLVKLPLIQLYKPSKNHLFTKFINNFRQLIVKYDY